MLPADQADRRTSNRASARHKIHYAARHPDRIPAHLRRAIRDLRLRLTARDHVAYYREVMRANTAKNPEDAVGSASHQRWLALGQMQFDYLLKHGLRPEDRVLDIGCGNLRGGWHLINHLEPGHYVGIDISPDILLAAQDTVVRHRLQNKLPYLLVQRDLRFAALPDAYFTVVHAHSVFSHSPRDIIGECLAHVGRILAPQGFFDFTFNRTEGIEHHMLWEDFYYRTGTLVELAGHYGLNAHLMRDWEDLPHRQSKIRVTHRSASG